MLLLGLVLAATASAAMLRSANHDKQKQLASVLGPEADATSPATKDLTMREGLGENLPYPSVDYLGVGYDLIHGNPSGDPDTQIDPGFRSPVVRLEWDQTGDHVSRDMRFLQPLGGYALPEYSCHMSSTAVEISSESDYQKSLEVDASLEVGYQSPVPTGGNASFSASAGFGRFSQEVAAKGSERFQMTSYCLQFVAGFNKGAGQKLEPVEHFAALAREVGQSKEEGQWFDFFKQYGTHFISKVHLGGKMIFEVTIDRSSLESMRSSNLDVSAAIAASFGPGSGSANVNIAMQQASKDALSKSKAETKTFVLGGLPPTTAGNKDLASGKTLARAGGKGVVRLSEDGYLWIEDKFGNQLWRMLGKANPGAVLKYDKTGNLLIEGPNGITWQTHTGFDTCSNAPPGKVELLDNGDFVVKSGEGTLMWSAGTAGGRKADDHAQGSGVMRDGCKPQHSDILFPGQRLWSGHSLVAGLASLHLAHTGRLILKGNNQELWNNDLRKTSGKYYLTLTKLGQLQILDADDRIVWLNGDGRQCLTKARKAQLFGDANFIVYDKQDEHIWSTDTFSSTSRIDHPEGLFGSGCKTGRRW
ncbi:hypothetical protein FNF27_05375 [Cafeteria roenbergensis]|uniref:Bulb-type lectin domain-containing protein n=1 Tax=Cafeteria roenbergensis TaxID=33653 RepID=A0A5A8EB66_CAFRO|nr:hypothetical protein FNF27_05375 [Cafeteria roenbergensis]